MVRVERLVGRARFEGVCKRGVGKVRAKQMVVRLVKLIEDHNKGRKMEWELELKKGKTGCWHCVVVMNPWSFIRVRDLGLWWAQLGGSERVSIDLLEQKGRFPVNERKAQTRKDEMLVYSQRKKSGTIKYEFVDRKTGELAIAYGLMVGKLVSTGDGDYLPIGCLKCPKVEICDMLGRMACEEYNEGVR